MLKASNLGRPHDIATGAALSADWLEGIDKRRRGGCKPVDRAGAAGGGPPGSRSGGLGRLRTARAGNSTVQGSIGTVHTGIGAVQRSNGTVQGSNSAVQRSNSAVQRSNGTVQGSNGTVQGSSAAQTGDGNGSRAGAGRVTGTLVGLTTSLLARNSCMVRSRPYRRRIHR
jgi:hypothetical protein